MLLAVSARAHSRK